MEIRSALDGNIVATVTMPGLSASSPIGFATDGSYLWAATDEAVRAWTTDGDLLAEASGHYSEASVSAMPGELRIAMPSREVIETISIATGTSSLSPAFEGTFHSWFLDGARFLTTTSSTVRVYSAATVMQEHNFSVPSLKDLTGQGDHVWTFSESYPRRTLDVYSLSDPTAPAASYDYGFDDRAVPTGNLIGVLKYGEPTIDVIELGAVITPSSVDVPGHYFWAFTTDDAGNWVLGGRSGELFESNELTRPLSCGAILTVARADDGTTAVGTAAGGTLLFELTADSRRYLGTIPFPSSTVRLSRDGRVLAAANFQDNFLSQTERSLRVFRLPDRSEIKTWTYSVPDDWDGRRTFSMSSQGNRFGHETTVFDDVSANWTYTQEVRDLEDSVSLRVSEVYGTGAPSAQLSADGTLVAAPKGSTTNVYQNGVLVNAFPGKPRAWFDDNRLLVNLDGYWRIYDSSGELQPKPRLMAQEYRFMGLRIVSATEIYSVGLNAIYSLTSGEELWGCGGTSYDAGAAAAGYAVFVSDKAPHKVVYDTY